MAKTFACLPAHAAGKFFKNGKGASTWWALVPSGNEQLLIILSEYHLDGGSRYHPVSGHFIAAFGGRVRGLLRKLKRDHPRIRLPHSGAECRSLCDELAEEEKVIPW